MKTSMMVVVRTSVCALACAFALDAAAVGRTLTVTAGGDAFMVQGFPKGFDLDRRLTSWIGGGDARLVNFETVVNDGTCRPAAWSGGT